MTDLFPRELVACIRDGRSPNSEELGALTEKLWNESISFWNANSTGLAIKMAGVALSGAHSRHCHSLYVGPQANRCSDQEHLRAA